MVQKQHQLILWGVMIGSILLLALLILVYYRQFSSVAIHLYPTVEDWSTITPLAHVAQLV